MIKVYSRYPIAVQEYNPNTDRTMILKGVNSHAITVPMGTPYCNEVEEEDWQHFLSKYGNRKAYFDKRNGDMFFTASSKADAAKRVADSKPVVDEKHIVTKQKTVENYKNSEVLG